MILVKTKKIRNGCSMYLRKLENLDDEHAYYSMRAIDPDDKCFFHAVIFVPIDYALAYLRHDFDVALQNTPNNDQTEIVRVINEVFDKNEKIIVLLNRPRLLPMADKEIAPGEISVEVKTKPQREGCQLYLRKISGQDPTKSYYILRGINDNDLSFYSVIISVPNEYRDHELRHSFEKFLIDVPDKNYPLILRKIQEAISNNPQITVEKTT